ncbi:Por secretion system C-terminal sorting domain-containing protein [Dyadobacter koreensis]|uniref:Por secretion system C-terminal sorting domain-containing protein n=2 Tax=Dyadobacter koreensis TaxID=408657 RepID=A0A1H6Z1C2_9BACT|nr:Por secretion system C-terminal sorting domain-containing protein [Dyadobacter koreensis]
MPQMEKAHNHKAIFEETFKYWIITFWILATVQFNNVYGQLRLVPISQNPNPESTTQQSARMQASINLPFFDDFSTTASSRPDPAFWMSGSGVYVNNTLATTHPSVNMATFDGLNSSGVPYNYTNQLSQGNTDTLTSVAINLGGLTPGDSVYLSFYWLAKGLGEFPDENDTLRLEFLNQNKQWVSVWQQNGMVYDSLFKQEFIPVRNAAFLHADFQFRFRAYGRLSGAYDTWHLDYLYLNKGRSINDRFIKDIAVRKPLTPFLKKYTSMPLKQFWVNPRQATADSVGTDILNLFNNFNFTTYTFTVKDELTGKQFQNYNGSASVFIGGSQTQKKSIALNQIAEDKSLKALKLRYKFNLITTDDQNPTIPSVNLRRNDTISARADLSDYYAYDDGGAEYGVQINQRLARAVVRFALSKPDTLAGIRMSIVPFNKDISGQSFTLQVWNNKNGKPDQLVVQKAVAARYPASRDSLVQYAFDNPVAVADTFYVGWLQINEEPLSIGFDRNSLLGRNEVFFNLGTEWVKDTGLNGSIMLRPYMGGKAAGVVTGTEEFEKDAYFFPNPNNGVLNWKNKQIRKIDIFSITGALAQTLTPQSGTLSVTIRDLPDGMYLLKASDGKRSFVQKMLIVK